MPDITMCNNDKCNKRESCYRFTATPSHYGQSYCNFSESGCEYYIKTGLKTKTRIKHENIQ
jgi:hypothetical protein